MLHNIKFAVLPVALMWAVYFANFFVPADLRQYGIHPRHTDYLPGIALMPLLHGNLAHLAANSGALIVLLYLSLSYSRRQTIAASGIIVLIGGGFVWMLGSANSIHIGASGLIFGLIGFLLFLGLFRHEWKAFFLSALVFFFYGGAFFSLLYHVPGISWTGHFFGFGSGIFAAWSLRNSRR